MRNIILDCDGAADDILALLLILAHPDKINLLGVTCVEGSVSIDQAMKNVRAALHRFERDDVPVFMGAGVPMDGQDRGNDDAYFVENKETGEIDKTGMNGVQWPQPPKPGFLSRLFGRYARVTAQDFLIDNVLKYSRCDARVTIVATGPLTNIAELTGGANLYTMDPEGQAIDSLVIMGGSDTVLDADGEKRRGNMTTEAEFNFHKDPDAAFETLSSMNWARTTRMYDRQIPITLATMSAIQGYDQKESPGIVWTPERLEKIAAIHPELAQIARTPESLDMSKFGAAGAFSFDVNTIVWMLRPDLYETERCRMHVDRMTGETNFIADPKGEVERLVRIPDPEAVIDFMIGSYRSLYGSLHTRRHMPHFPG